MIKRILGKGEKCHVVGCMNKKNITKYLCLLLIPLLLYSCVFPPILPERGSRFSLGALIQPLPENHGSWSREEVDTVKEIIMTTLESHNFKKKGFPDEGYALYGENFVLRINASFAYDEGKSYEREHRMDPFYNEPGSLHISQSLLRRPIDVRKEKGTIGISISYHSYKSSITDSERLFVEKIWHEMLDPLRTKFGERLEEGKPIKIYKLED